MKGFAARPWLIVPIVSAIHLTYAVLLHINPDVSHITGLHVAQIIFGPILSWVLTAVALLAISPMVFDLSAATIHLCLWPQQFMLFLMALSAVAASSTGIYPDGTERGVAFVTADQCYAVYLMLGHLAATIRNASYED